MRTLFAKKLKIILSSCLLMGPTFQTAQAQCEVGTVIVRDTLFGAGIGLGVGALFLVANQNSNNIAPNLATATLIGAGVGAVVGIVELSLSDCSFHKNAMQKVGFKARPMLTFLPQSTYHEVTHTKSSDSDYFNSLNHLAMGLTVSYTFHN